jgi:hypothetical protein
LLLEQLKVKKMILYYNKKIVAEQVGISELKKSLQERNISCIERHVFEFDLNLELPAILVRFFQDNTDCYPQIKTKHELESEGYELVWEGKVLFINAFDRTGALYGLLDVAETVRNQGLESVVDMVEKPFHAIRGVKHNLPYEPYDDGSPFTENKETMMTFEYWKAYIEMLAKNRYNCLSLWSENPFHMMFRLSKYPNTCPYSDEQLNEFQKIYSFIFTYARELGIQTYLITWNIRITEQVAIGLGLPKQLAKMSFYNNCARNVRVGLLNNHYETDSARQAQQIIKDYFIECIRTLLLTYRNLTGIGTSSSEEMAGTIEARIEWVRDCYLEGIRQSGRKIPFIFRTNNTVGASVSDVFMKDYTFGETYLSWKYSNAHMYSSTKPQFENEWKAWEGIELGDTNIVYTVRNDDFHTFRGGSAEFLKKYISNMKKPHVKGFYWGADGYVWGKDFQHVPHKHMTWEFDFQRHWYEFALMGRLGYNPELSDDHWVFAFEHRFSKDFGKLFFDGFTQAMRIFPALQRTSWINYDFESHPEAMLTVTGFRTVLTYMDQEAMPGIGTISVNETALAELSDTLGTDENTRNCLSIISKAASSLKTIIENIESSLQEDQMGGELECTLLDLKCWEQLGCYYGHKLSAALLLCKLRETGDESYRKEAVSHLREAVTPYEKLCLLWGSHYMPYKLVRSKYIFGYTYYLDDVKKDIRLAQNIRF